MGLNFNDQQNPAMPNHRAMNLEHPLGTEPKAEPAAPAAEPRIQEGTPEPGGGVKKSIFDIVADFVHAPGDALQAGKKPPPSAKMAQTPATAPKPPGMFDMG